MEELYKSFCRDSWNEGFAYGVLATLAFVILITLLAKLAVFFGDQVSKDDENDTKD